MKSKGGNRWSLFLAILVFVSLETPRTLHALQAPPTEADARQPALFLKNRGLTYNDSAGLVQLPGRIGGALIFATRESVWFADVLLATGMSSDSERAVAILTKVVATQHDDVGSRWYGLWPTYVGEPMGNAAHVDINWGEFVSFGLLETLAQFDRVLPPKLIVAMDTAIRRAAQPLIARRLGSEFNNIWVLNTVDLAMAAARYGDPKLQQIVQERSAELKRLVVDDHNLSEFNSPTYVLEVDIYALTRARESVPEAGIRHNFEQVEDVICGSLAAHFDPATNQIAGPQSRAYFSLLTGPDQDLLASALGLQGRTPDCGKGLGGVESIPRVVVDTFFPVPHPQFGHVDRTELGGILPVIGTTQITSTFALGSASVGDFWSQRRSLLAYWGTQAKPGYMRVRVLKNGADLTAAQLFARQADGAVLAAIAFATDVADGHPDVAVDSLRAPITDLRLRFEFGGAVLPVSVPIVTEVGGLARLQVAGVPVVLAVPLASVGDWTPRWESSNVNGTDALDLVLYHGPPVSGQLSRFRSAAIGITIQVGTLKPGTSATVTSKNGMITLDWDGMHLSEPLAPMPLDSLHRQVREANGASNP